MVINPGVECTIMTDIFKEENMRQLLQVKGTVTPQCSKSHITYTFNLKGESRRLKTSFSYEPKSLEHIPSAQKIICRELKHYIQEEDLQQYLNNWKVFLPLNNLITLSFDDSACFRGCAHRHDHDQLLIISESMASPGLVPGRIPSGLFKITLSIHAIVTDICNYSLQVWEGDETSDQMGTF